MEEQYNRVIRTEPFTYYDALKLCYRLVNDKMLELDKIDIHGQNLSGDYKLTILALEQLFLRTPEQITNATIPNED